MDDAHEFIGSFVTFFLALLLWRARPMVIWLLTTAAVVMHFTDPLLIAFVAGTGLAWVMSRFVVQLSLGVALCCIAAGIYLFGIWNRAEASWLCHSAGSSPLRFDRIAIHTVSDVLIILGLVANDRLGQSLASAPFRLLGRLSSRCTMLHLPLLCSLAAGCSSRCGQYLVPATLLVVATLSVAGRCRWLSADAA